MSTLIPITGRKTLKAILTYFVIYTLLTLGGITMVIPFLLMVSISFRSKIDGDGKEIIPRYFYNKDWLKLKYVEQESLYDMDIYNGLARAGIADFSELVKDDPDTKSKQVTLPTAAKLSEQEDYYKYLESLPDTFTMLTCRGEAVALGAGSTEVRRYGVHPAVVDYRKAMLEKYKTVEAIEKAQGVQLVDVESMVPAGENWHLRTTQPDYDRRLIDSFEFKRTQLAKYRVVPVPAEGAWNMLLRAKYAKDVAVVNKDYGTNYNSVDTAPISPRLPEGSEALRAAWEDCVRNSMSVWYVRADQTAKSAWQHFLSSRYANDIKNYNTSHPGSAYTHFEDIPLPEPDGMGEKSLIASGMSVGEWSDFLSQDAPLSSLYLDTPEQRYREFLKTKYRTIEELNASYASQYKDWSELYPPAMSVKVAEAEQNISAIRWEFIIRNYRTVSGFMVLHGRSFLNTALLILLALFFTLTINPITAYSLSRFKLRSTNKILLLLLATMAFPAEISMIPNFLILKNLHMLNTYWALILPVMANGFSIFLLKGMFDGLPQDLYEAAMLDGAGEAVIFWKITMPLVKPFLAYLSLGTFVAYYSMFMFAMLLCPDPMMWTIMVYLQQMGSWASQPVMFAAYTLASIPTLIVFVTCQRVIMQGIVLPTEK